MRVVRRDEGEDLRAVTRPPFAPAVRTDIVPRPTVRVLDVVVPLLRAVTRPPFAPARFFCAVVPPCEGLLPEPDFLPPRLDEPGELAMRAARCLDMPFFLRPSY